MNIDPRFDALDAKIDRYFSTVDEKVDRHFIWMVGIVITTWPTTIVSIYLHH